MTLARLIPLRSSTFPAAGVALAVAGWFAVVTTLTEGPGLFEARFLALQAALVVAGLSLGLIASSGLGARPSVVSPFLLTSAVPFLALIGLPFGLRSLAAATLLIPVGLTARSLWQSYHHGCQQQDGKPPWPLLDSALIAIALTMPFLLEPVAMLTANVGERLALLASATAIGVGIAWLSRAWGVRALLAGSVVLLFGGLNWFAGASLLAVAAIESVLSHRSAFAQASHDGGRAPASLSPMRGWLKLFTAIALIAIACALSWAGLFLIMAVWAQRARRGWLAAMVVAGALLALTLPSTAWRIVSRDLLVFLLVFPFTAASLLRSEATANWLKLRLGGDQLWRLLTGLALAAVALRTQPSGLALIPAALHWCAPVLGSDLGEANQTPSESPEPARQTGPRDGLAPPAAQALWLNVWLAALMLGSSYPWLRTPALMAQIDEVRGVGGTPSGVVIALCCFAALACALVIDGAQSAKRGWWLILPRLGASVVLLFSCALVLFGLTPQDQETLHRWPPQVMSAITPKLEYAIAGGIEEGPSIDVWLDTYLANAAELAPGTAVASVRLDDHSSSGTALRAGQHTAEWSTLASSSPGSCTTTQLTPFAYWWTDDDPPRLGQRFRTRVSVASAGGGTTLRIERNETLPTQVQLRVDRVAIARSGRQP